MIFRMITWNIRCVFLLKHAQLYRTLSRSYKLSHLIYKNEIPNPSSSIVPEKVNTIKSGSPKSKLVEDWGDVVGGWYKKYQNFVGITEILEAQENVTVLTNQLFGVQTKRRKLQCDVEGAHQQLLLTHQRITGSELYSEDYYSLREKALQLNTTLKSLQNQFSQTEEEERSLFTQLSAAIRYCHEKERTQSENSKYWSVLISVISATLAALITSINNWVRIKEIKDHASLLHKDTMDKTDRLQDVISNVAKGNAPVIEVESKVNPFSSETFIQTIQSTLRDEMKQIICVLKETSGKGDLNKHFENEDICELSTYQTTSQEVSYTRIVGSMLTGAILGTLITACFLGSAGGGG